ncbi:hypothetical protein H4R99_003926 [Coemansia sp. RSA 1722]|nr:hypothetical protein H4R99_003926 [Coemansia sp. RSA 1722]KAJ2638255.1 hypothetical protein GGF40_001790 [Coemansia sp. RSA 1286]
MFTSDPLPSASPEKADIVNEAAQQLRALDLGPAARSGSKHSGGKHKRSGLNSNAKGKKTIGKNMHRRATEADMSGFKASETKVFEQREFTNGTAKRMIFIGDIHGCAEEFTQLLDEVKYVPGEDQVVLVGDLVAKGPDSIGVVRKARKIGAWCVKGNHDDRVVRWREFLNGPAEGASRTNLEASDLPYSDFEIESNAHYDIARRLSPADYEFMAAFPAIMGLPDPFAEYVVAHGGIDPSKPILEQNPEDVMTMRNIGTDGPSSEKDDGLGWFEVWAAKMKVLTLPSNGFSAKDADYSVIRYNKVIYGHDAGRDLNIRDYTKGLDSRCVYGGKLTAFILPGEEMVSVACQNYDGGSNDRRRRRRDNTNAPRHGKHGKQYQQQRRLQERDDPSARRKVHPRKQDKRQPQTQGTYKNTNGRKRQNHSKQQQQQQQQQQDPLPE